MDIMALIDELEDAIESGGKTLLSGKRTVDTAVVGDVLDRIRAAVPQEIHTAHEIRARSEGIVTEAVVAARQIRATAERDRQTSVQESSVIQDAQNRAKQITAEAEEEAAKLRRQGDHAAARRVQEADSYAESALTRLGGEVEVVRAQAAVLNSAIVELEKAVDLGAKLLKSGRTQVGKNGANGAKSTNGAAPAEQGLPGDEKVNGLGSIPADGVIVDGDATNPLDVDSIVAAARQKGSGRG